MITAYYAWQTRLTVKEMRESRTAADATRRRDKSEAAARRALESTHLPPAHHATPQLLDMLASAPDADPFVGPDQEALEQLLAQMEPSQARA